MKILNTTHINSGNFKNKTMHTTAKCLPIILLLINLLPGVVQAALVEVNISGNTDNSESNGIVYTPGGTFTARAIYDTDVTDRNTDINVGTFSDATGETALISFELSTSLGTVSFVTADLLEPTLVPVVQQIQQPFGVGQSVTTLYSSTFSPAPKNGFSSSIDGFSPDTFSFSLVGSGPDNYFFTNPNELFSDTGALTTDAAILGGVINLFDSRTANMTTLAFGATEFRISAVPAPAALWLFSSGLIGVFSISRRHNI